MVTSAVCHIWARVAETGGRLLVEGALSVQILLVGLLVLVDGETSLKDNHG